MDCNRESDLGDDSPLSHDEHSDHDDDMRDCESGDENTRHHLNSSKVSSIMDYAGNNSNNNNNNGVSCTSINSGITGSNNNNGGGGGGGGSTGGSSLIGSRTPEPINDLQIGLHHPHSHHHPQFPTNHPLNALGNFMGIAGLHNLPNLQHGDVLEKLKMQVRDMKVGLMDQEYSPHSGFPPSLTTPVNTAFSLPPATNLNSFAHSPQNLSQSHQQQQQQQQQSHSSNGFSFTSPNVPCTKDDFYSANPGSNSSTSSEASNSSQQNNGWSFEEQYKQVRQLYEINDDPKRKEFLDDLFSYMQKRGTPINRLPIMAKSVLDLYELYNLVIARGGLVDVINKKLWQEIIKGLHLPSSITSAAFTLRTQYMKYLYPYECEKKNLSSPSELQAAIDGNRREGRRSSYGQFEAMHNQLQMPQMQRPNVPNNMQQMSPLALVTHANQQAAAAAAAHHRLMAPPLGQMPNIVTHELEQRMMEYLKLFQTQQKETARRSQSPEITPREALNALEMSRVALWSMYNNNTSPPSSVNTSPQGVEPQREALNLSDSPPNIAIKREREHSEPPVSDREDFHQPPPAKKGNNPPPPLPPISCHSTNQILLPAISTTTTVTTTATSGQYDDEESHDNSRNISTDSNDHMNGHHHHNHHHLHNHIKDHQLTPLSSPLKNHLHHNGIHNNNNNNNDELPFQSGMQFKVTRRGNGANGEQQLVVSLELNGVQYEGVLFANSAASLTVGTTATSTTTTTAAAAAAAVVASATNSLALLHQTSPTTIGNSGNRTSGGVVKETTLEEQRARSLVSS